MTTAKFVYEISIEAPEHTPENIEEMFGESGFIPEYKEDVWAREDLGSLFQDAITHCLMMKMECLTNKEGSSERLPKFLDTKIKLYEELRNSLKYIRKE